MRRETKAVDKALVFIQAVIVKCDQAIITANRRNIIIV